MYPLHINTVYQNKKLSNYFDMRPQHIHVLGSTARTKTTTTTQTTKKI